MDKPDCLNIYQKLAKIRKPVEVIQKNKSGFGYKYVTEDVILAKITGLMNSLGVSLIPKIKPSTTKVEPYSYKKTKARKDGSIYEENVNEILVHSDMEFEWVNNDNPEDKIPVSWTFVGQQSDASQAFGSGLTYATRYFLLKFFNVATSDDDPDHWRSMQKEAEATEDKEIASKINENITAYINSYLETHMDKKQDVIKIIKKYAKENGKSTANYNVITNPEISSQLFDEIKNTFKMEEQ